MERRLTGIDKQEALRYLGCQAEQPPAELRLLTDWACQELMERTRPRAVWRRFKLEGPRIAGTTLCLEGQDIMDHLRGCHEVILMAATLGREVEELLLRSQVRDLAKAVTLDCCASAAIESVCNDLEEELRQMAEGEGLSLTGRFSPGYGDLPLAQQGQVCALLDVQRQIGLTLTSSGLMVPRKSVTAILGLSKSAVPTQKHSCDRCSLRDTCLLRKGGRSCEKSDF